MYQTKAESTGELERRKRCEPSEESGCQIIRLALLTAQLFEVQPTDPMVFAGVTLALATAGLVACVVPARRATRADPIASLRLE